MPKSLSSHSQSSTNGRRSESSERHSEAALSPSDAESIASPITMPCGRVIKNRLVKAAMYEHLATFSGGPPNELHLNLYSKWARGGWGMIITGNCMISSSHLTLGRDTMWPLNSEAPQNLDAFKALSAAIHSGDTSNPSQRTLAILQVNHAGRQSPRFIGGRWGTSHRPVAPSSRRVGDDTSEGWLAKATYNILFQTPITISKRQIEDLIEMFVNAAQMAVQADFDGMQIHASHGYMLSQFLSPKLNTRGDEYSDAIYLIRKIVQGVRAVVPSNFVLGIKLNAGDYVTGGLTEDQALEHVREISLMKIDFIEISGGSYENPSFVGAPSTRQAFFSSFSRRATQALSHDSGPLIMLTGSLRIPSQFVRVLQQKHAHLLGIGRLSVLCPDLPRLISPESIRDERRVGALKFPLPEPRLFRPSWFPKLLGAGVETAWYIVGMRNIAKNRDVDLRMGSFGALFWMWIPRGPVNFTQVVPLLMGGQGIRRRASE